MTSPFTARQLKAVGKSVHPLGLALNYGIDAAGLEQALERGVNYLFYTRMRTGHLVPTLKAALGKNRERYVIASGPSMAFFARDVRVGLEGLLRKLGTDYLDVLQVFWAGVTSSLRPAVIDELVRLRESGKVRAIGVSIHDRERAGRLAEDSPLDLFMIRYNAAHPGAERDIFPHLAKRRPALVAYTATSWGKLLKAPKGWSEAPMTPGDCYRFCLTDPHVDVVLNGPKNFSELEQNLTAVERGPMSDTELQHWRSFGQLVHG